MVTIDSYINSLIESVIYQYQIHPYATFEPLLFVFVVRICCLCSLFVIVRGLVREASDEEKENKKRKKLC